VGAALTGAAVPVAVLALEHPASETASSATMNGLRAARMNASSIE
jgi:hypothetical protein